ncbi:MAG: 16S rRNA (cytosine(967)-C(5))-methyltransferase RsmB, partial [Solobacterium sp.]|nr:16S rRNA (cytosine(967)-C(5))-methyltransferase RsmB [Solobacterium sp.]
MNARETAVNIVYRVLYEGGYASLLLRQIPKDCPKEDRGLISEIVYGTLRNRSLLELQLKDLAKKRVRPKTAALLDVSLYQLYFMDRIPAYAVIDEAVRLAAKQEKGFVNAVLRRASERDPVQPREEG